MVTQISERGTVGYEIFMSPLDDPVFGAIYANAEVAGLAMESLIKAVLESDNELFNGRIESITPQQVHLSPTERGFRVDVEVLTDTNERWLIEVQVNTDRNIMLRNLVVASHVFYGSSDRRRCAADGKKAAKGHTHKHPGVRAKEGQPGTGGAVQDNVHQKAQRSGDTTFPRIQRTTAERGKNEAGLY